MSIIIKVDELIKVDMLKMVQVLTDTLYIKMNPNVKLMMRIEGDVSTIFDTVGNVDIVQFNVTKKKKYSVIWNSVVVKFKLDRKEVAKKVASNIMEYIKGYGEIKEIKLDLTDIGFEVEGTNEDKYIELSDVYYRVDTMGMKKQEVLMAIKEYEEVVEENILSILSNIDGVDKYYDKDSDAVCVDTGTYLMTGLGKRIEDEIRNREDAEIKLYDAKWVGIPHYNIRMKNNKKYYGEGDRKCTKKD